MQNQMKRKPYKYTQSKTTFFTKFGMVWLGKRSNFLKLSTNSLLLLKFYFILFKNSSVEAIKFYKQKQIIVRKRNAN